MATGGASRSGCTRRGAHGPVNSPCPGCVEGPGSSRGLQSGALAAQPLQTRPVMPQHAARVGRGAVAAAELGALQLQLGHRGRGEGAPGPFPVDAPEREVAGRLLEGQLLALLQVLPEPRLGQGGDEALAKDAEGLERLAVVAGGTPVGPEDQEVSVGRERQAGELRQRPLHRGVARGVLAGVVVGESVEHVGVGQGIAPEPRDAEAQPARRGCRARRGRPPRRRASRGRGRTPSPSARSPASSRRW